MHGGGRSRSRPSSCCKAYASGIFPMAESADDPSLFWVEPQRARRHSARRLPRRRRGWPDGPAGRFRGARRSRLRRRDRRLRRRRARPQSTWINAPIRAPLWRAVRPRPLPYGRSLGATAGSPAASTAWRSARAFFGESMFHRARDASKVALVHLVGAAAGRRLHAARHPVRDRAPGAVRRGRGAAPRL